jgi:hypothetical protein
LFGTNRQTFVRVAKKDVCFETKRKAGAVSLYKQSQAASLMTTRKDSEKDSERPHYYSQFWLDIAAGKRIIGGPKPEDSEALENETADPVLQRRSGRASESETFSNAATPANGYQEDVAQPITEEEYSEPEDDLVLDQDELQDADYQEDLPLDDDDVPDVDLSAEEEEIASEENEALEENEPDYDDEDAEWGGRGSRKKSKPTRPNKAPIKKTGKTRRF